MIALYMSLIDNDKSKSKFELIYDTYKKRMFNVAYSVLNNKEDAEDAVHDTFIKIALNIDSIEDPESDKTLSFVLKATKNTAINIYNKNRRSSYVSSEKNIDDIPDEKFIEKLNITKKYNEVVNAILELDDIYKDVMFYHFVIGMSISQISDLLNRKKSTVKQQLVRGKKILIEKVNNDRGDYYG